MLAERACLPFRCCLLYLEEFLASCVMKFARCDVALLHLPRPLMFQSVRWMGIVDLVR
jgi:hypothetical protein